MRMVRRCCRRRRSSKLCSCTRLSSTRRTSSTTCKTSSKVGRPHACAVRQHVHTRGSAIGGCAVRFALVRHVRRAGVEVAPTGLDCSALWATGVCGAGAQVAHERELSQLRAEIKRLSSELAKASSEARTPYAAVCGWLQLCAWLDAIVMCNGNPRWALTSAAGGGAERVEQRHHRVEPRVRRGVPLLPGSSAPNLHSMLRVASSSMLHVALLGGTGGLQIGSVQLPRRIFVRCSVAPNCGGHGTRLWSIAVHPRAAQARMRPHRTWL